MSKFEINYSELETAIVKKAYRLDEVKDRIERVAFDVVRFRDDDDGANLWKIQSADDGDYIVAIYQQEPEEKTANDWSVQVSKIASALLISYKGDPIIRIASANIGIPPTELPQAEKYLPKKLAENKKLVKALLNELEESAKKEVLNKYPELV